MKNSALVVVLVLTACGGSSLPADEVRLAQVEISAPGLAFPERTSLQLRAFGFYTDGHKVDLTRLVSWSSSDEAAVLVTNEGVAVLRGTGRVVVSATLGTASASQVLTSTPAQVRALALGPASPGPVARGSLVQLSATVWFTDGTSRDVTAEAQWSSTSARLTPTAQPGLFLAAGEGEAVARATFDGFSAEQTLLVTGPTLEALGVVVPGGVLHPGEARQLQAQARYSDGTGEDLAASCKWTSSDLAAATVSAGGLLVAHAPGRATVRAVCGAGAASRDFAVWEKAPMALTLPAGLVLAAGLDGLAQVGVRFDDGSIGEPGELALFSSDDVLVATVSNEAGRRGTVHAVAPGTASITVWVGELSAALTVTVLPPVLQALSVTLPGGRVVVNQRATFAVFGRFSDGTSMNLTSAVALQVGPGASASPGDGEVALIARALGAVTVQASVAGQVTQFTLDVTSAVPTALEVRTTAGSADPRVARLEALATWSDGVQTVVTELADWSGSDDAVAIVHRAPGARGAVQAVAGGPFTVHCQLGADAASYSLVLPIAP